MEADTDVVIVGGGLAGLACARQLHAAGRSFRLFEATDRLGGRVAHEVHEGFVLDRGFQVLLTAYPEAQQAFDYASLDLRAFEPGALVRFEGQFHRLSDPWRRPRHLLATALSRVATLGDKLKVAAFRQRTQRGSLAELYAREETTTEQLLRTQGFSDVILERFFRPFFGGVFLERELSTSSRKCEFVFRMFSQGEAAVPARGMGTLPDQLAADLPPDALCTGSRVESVEQNAVVLTGGERHRAQAIVVAAEAPGAQKLLGEEDREEGWPACCLYFSAEAPPIEEPILVLNGDGKGPINNLCVPSQVSNHYAPPGRALISVSVLGSQENSDALLRAVTAQLTEWFGDVVREWVHLKTVVIPFALPAQPVGALDPVEKASRRPSGLFVCGDYCDTASINGALASGRRAATEVLSQLHA